MQAKLAEAAMAWMRMMGADSVAYHRATVINRSDDHPGQALEYYASRGETPLEWGGSGAAALGLTGNVTDAQYEAIYGPGGAKDPATAEQLTRTRRPGMELVIAAHKSVAELGVIGRAEDMHAVMDAERDATLAYLDALTRRQGGRRGDAAVATPTTGLVYAVTRHATSRAGDPAPHDHVLIANAVEMLDERGGWKAADTALWREHLHAATMVGRVAAARAAVDLGYGIVADHGPSGRLGHWAIAGIPAEVMELHSKRAAEIRAEAERLGQESPRARAVIARATRAHKRHEPVGDLVVRWRDELASIGWPVAELERSVSEARRVVRRHFDAEETRQLVSEVLASDGPLAARKVFARRDVVVAVAPALFGLEPAELRRVVAATLADPEVAPLVAKPSARERVYATASTIATEQAIAAAVDVEVHRHDAPAVLDITARRAIAEREQELGASLTVGQRQAVMGVATSGRGVDLVVGVAGSGKTTALAAVREAFAAEGLEVIGTSTSGQAARTLHRQAGIDPSRTLASLCWRLDHRQLALTERHVVVLDEAAMTEDTHLLRLLDAASAARAKVVLVGDHCQLGAVGPGGGFEALVARYGAAVHVLAENVRQRNVDERAALAQLRDGDVAEAVAWYVANGRIVTGTDRAGVIEATVAGWAADVAESRQAQMYAWRRANVAELNRLGREAWRAHGRLGDKELVAPGGARYAAGDRVVTLAPGAGGKVVTSETGTVAAIDDEAKALAIRMDDGASVRTLAADEIGAGRLAHAYAITVHRSQGSTVERAHALEDGGGRELAYVKMSRAKDRSTVYVVADSADQAADDLRREWSTERRLVWVTESEVPVSEPAVTAPIVEPPRWHMARERERLLAERQAIIASIPPDPAAAIRAAQGEYARLRHQRDDLAAGKGRYAGTAIGHAAREVESAEKNMADLRRRLSLHPSRRDRRRIQSDMAHWQDCRSTAAQRLTVLSAPEIERLDQAEHCLTDHRSALEAQRDERQVWIRAHDVRYRLQRIDAGLQRLDAAMGVPYEPPRPAGIEPDRLWLRPPPALERTLGIDLGP